MEIVLELNRLFFLNYFLFPKSLTHYSCIFIYFRNVSEQLTLSCLTGVSSTSFLEKLGSVFEDPGGGRA